MRSELDSLEVDPAYLSSIIDSYGARRLLTFDRDAATRSATVEVAHEALLHEWGRLRGWLEAKREDVQAERRLAAATAEWNEAGQDPSVLLRGDRLARVEAWVGVSGMALTRDERAFLDASLAHRSAATSAEAARAAREATVERRSKRRLQGMVALFATLAIVAGVLTAVAVGHQRRSELDARIATGRELAAAAVANLDVDPERSILLALEGVAVTDGIDASLAREVREALHRALWRSRLVVSVPMGGRVAVSADGSRFATTRADGGATVWDLQDGTELLTVTGHLGAVTAVAFDPTGRDLATVGADGTLRLWDGVTGAQLRLIRVPPATADVEFSPDGRRLGTIDADQTVRLWSLTTGRQERALPDPLSDLTTADVFATLAFSPDGHLVASSRGHAQATVWDVATGRQKAVLTGHEWEVADIAFAPDGRKVATASVDSTAKVWDPSTGRLLATLADHTGDVHSVAYSADGRRIATGATDGIARVWDSESGALQLSLAGHRDTVGSLGFSPDGGRLVTGSGDGSTRLWDITVGRRTGLGDRLRPLGTHRIRRLRPEGRRLRRDRRVDRGHDPRRRHGPTHPCARRPRRHPRADHLQPGRTQAGRRSGHRGLHVGGQPDRPDLGHRDGCARHDPHGPRGRGLERRVQPGRATHRHEQLGRHGPGVGRHHGHAAGHRAHRVRRVRVGLQPGRPPAGGGPGPHRRLAPARRRHPHPHRRAGRWRRRGVRLRLRRQGPPRVRGHRRGGSRLGPGHPP